MCEHDYRHKLRRWVSPTPLTQRPHTHAVYTTHPSVTQQPHNHAVYTAHLSVTQQPHTHAVYTTHQTVPESVVSYSVGAQLTLVLLSRVPKAQA